MKVAVVTVGKFKSDELQTLVGYYFKLSSKFAQFEHVELSFPKGSTEQSSQDQALLKLLEKRGSRAFLTLLDERGKLFSSREFASRIEKIKDGSYSEWIIAVGGAHGYGEALKSRAQLLWSLSPLTMAHELATAVAAEQLFRGFSILHGHPYHNG